MNEVICYADVTELAERIRTKALSPVEVVRAHLERIEALDPRLNAVATSADGADPYALPVPAPEFPDLEAALGELRVGWCSQGPFAPVDGEVKVAVARAASSL